MNEDKIIDRLRAKAASDARAFRKQFGKREQPNEKWLDNSFTAAVPLVTEAAELPPGTANSRLFEVYKQEVMRELGVDAPPRQDSEADRRDKPGTLVEEPTPGEN